MATITDSARLSQVDYEKAGTADEVPALIESGASPEESRKNCARLMHNKIHFETYLSNNTVANKSAGGGLKLALNLSPGAKKQP